MLLLNILEKRFKIVQVRSGLQLIVQVILNSRLYIEAACTTDGSHVRVVRNRLTIQDINLLKSIEAL